MSIFGVKRKHVDTLALKQEIFNMRGQAFSQINNLNDRHTGLQNTVREMHINHRLLYNKVENIPDKTKFLNGKISFIKRYLPHYNLCYMPLPLFQK